LVVIGSCSVSVKVGLGLQLQLDERLPYATGEYSVTQYLFNGNSCVTSAALV